MHKPAEPPWRMPGIDYRYFAARICGFQRGLHPLASQTNGYKNHASDLLRWVRHGTLASRRGHASMTHSLTSGRDEIVYDLRCPEPFTPQPQRRRYATFLNIGVQSAYADS